MRYKCIIFDCDGVLVDSESISARIFRDMAIELGFELDYDTALKAFAGTSMKENLKFIRDNIEGELPDDFEKEFRRRTYESFQKELKPVEGVHQFIEKVKVPFCVASSGPVSKIRLNLTLTGLIDKFENRIFSSYDIGSWKPDPGIYLHTAGEMGFSPGDCVVIEDSEAGVQAAVAGGFDVFAFADEGKKGKFEQLGANVFFHMNELSSLLKMDEFEQHSK